MDTDGRLVGGRYRLLEELGNGGMGTVWRARDEVLDRDVAVKEVRLPRGVTDEEGEVLRERTRREARAAARLDSPSAVTVFDVVEEDDQPYLVMELVEARTLSEVLREDGPLTPARAAEVGLAVLDALGAAHAQGIVHRDVKPGNVMLRPDGRVVLTDFGIATTTGDAALTSTGLLLGSPAYIAPERARGEEPGPASDLWSLGATLYAAVEGRPPYDGGQPLLTVTAVVTGEHEPFVLAGPLAPVIEALLDKDPTTRLDAAGALGLLTEVARDPSAAAGAPATDADPAVPSTASDPEPLPPSGEQTAALHLPPQTARLADPVPAAAVRRPAGAPAVRRGRGLATALGAGVLGLAAVVGVGLSSSWDLPGSGPSAAPSDGTPTRALPDGWERVSTPGAASVGVPSAWEQSDFNGAPQWKDDQTGRTLRVTTTPRGKDDVVGDRRAQAKAFARTHDDYDEIRIEEVDYRGLPTADWEFTYRDGGADLHALSRVFVTDDGRGWSLFFQTRASDDWSDALDDFEVIAASVDLP